MFNTRLFLSTVTGLFFLILAAFSLAQNRWQPLNRHFAFFNLTSGIWSLTGYVLILLPREPALVAYRLIQLCGPLTLYFLIRFVQELAGTAGEVWSVRARRWSAVAIFASAPLFFSPLILKDFFDVRADPMRFAREPGAAYPLFVALLAGLAATAVLTVVRCTRQSSGLKRNQMKFVILAMGFGAASVFFQILSMTVIDIPAAYFSLQICCGLSFAYAIFKYRLFEFSRWRTRLLIACAVYVPLISVPFFLAPVLDEISRVVSRSPLLFPAAAIGYALLFSAAPFLTTFLSDRAEEALSKQLKQHLVTLRRASTSLIPRAGTDLAFVAECLLGVLQDFYWNRLRAPLRFLMVVVQDADNEPAVAQTRGRNVDRAVLKTFLDRLRILRPSDAFTRLDLENRLMRDAATGDDVSVLISYVRKNEIELCVPCVMDGDLMGVLLMGSKPSGVFGEDEMQTLHLIAAQTASAVKNAILSRKAERLEGIDRLKRDLISNVTHEFKSPIAALETAIDGMMDDLQRGTVNRKDLVEFLLIARNNASRLSVFVTNLLELARIQQNTVKLESHVFSLREVADEAVRLLRPLFSRKDVSVAVQSAESFRMEGDRDKLVQVMVNLVSNAIKFTESGTVTIALEKIGDEKVSVSVRDTGQGFDPSEATRIFSRFVTSKGPENRRGSGLGLAIAKGWVEAHGGRLWAESSGPGKGARFVAELPLAL